MLPLRIDTIDATCHRGFVGSLVVEVTRSVCPVEVGHIILASRYLPEECSLVRIVVEVSVSISFAGIDKAIRNEATPSDVVAVYVGLALILEDELGQKGLVLYVEEA